MYVRMRHYKGEESRLGQRIRNIVGVWDYNFK